VSLRVAVGEKNSSTRFSQCESCDFWAYKLNKSVMSWHNGVVAYKGAYSLILSREYAAEQQDTGQSLTESNCGGKTTKPQQGKKRKSGKAIDYKRTSAWTDEC
jgi:hypothetical protein